VEDSGGLVLDEGEDTIRLVFTTFSTSWMRFIAVKMLFQEKFVMAAGGKDGVAPCSRGSRGLGSFCLSWNLRVSAGQASSGEESR